MALDIQQRYDDHQELFRLAMDGQQSELWTAIPGIIQSFDPVAITVVVKPAIQATLTGADLSRSSVDLPVLPDVPVVFPRGGGYTLTFPIIPGDECLVVFSARCIDNWWDQGGVQSQYDMRMHDLSDGFAIVGPFSQKTKISNISTTTTQLREDGGQGYVEVDNANKRVSLVQDACTVVVDSTKNTISLTAPTVIVNASSQLQVNSPESVFSGKIVANGDVSGAGTTLDTHIHSNSGGNGNSGPPVPGS